jgi:hypothetical protein
MVPVGHEWAQLRRLCDLSGQLPHPRFLDPCCGASSEGETGAAAACAGEMVTASGSSSSSSSSSNHLYYLRCPPRTTLRRLGHEAPQSRASWRITGQVVFVRKISVTLRCTVCQVLARQFHRLSSWVCAKCSVSHTLSPFWEAVIAFDDGTGEGNLHVEGKDVFSFLKARFDERACVLQQIARKVNQLVESAGGFVYDAFDDSQRVDYATLALQRTYSTIVQEEAASRLQVAVAQAAADTSAATTGGSGDAAASTAGVGAGTGPRLSLSHALFDLERSAESQSQSRTQSRTLVPRIDIDRNPTGVKVATILKAYLQIGSCLCHYDVDCAINYSLAGVNGADQNGAASGESGSKGSAAGAARKQGNQTRTVKLQKNNCERPYLSFFALRPTSSEAKVSLEVLNVRELHGSALVSRTWDMVHKLKK